MLIDLRQRLATVDAVFEDDALPADVAATLRSTAHRALAGESLAAAARAYTWGLTSDWPIEGFISFAAETWTEYQRLPQWRALRRRRALGPRLSRKNPAFVATEMVHRTRRAHRTRVQERKGL
jgi:hypothetical protein